MEQYRPLFEAVCGGDLHGVNNFLFDQPEALTAHITLDGNTPLHIAVMFGHLHIVKRLLQLMSADDVLVTNVYGWTALFQAVTDRKKNEIAKCLINKNSELHTIPNGSGDIPLWFATLTGNTEMTYYLYSITPFEVLLPESGAYGAELIIAFYYSNMFDMVLDLLNRCPRLAVTPTCRGTYLLQKLAKPRKILNESELPFWKRWMYKWVPVVQQPASSLNEIPVSIPESNTIHYNHVISICPGIQKMQKAKLAEKQYLEILHAACDAISPTNPQDMEFARISLMIAVEQGNVEFVLELIKAEFSLALSWANGQRNIFHLSIECRQPKVFSLIHGFVLKQTILSSIDDKNNTMLHSAGMLGPSPYLNQISGAALQMQRELQWFKEVENIAPSLLEEVVNGKGKIPREYFTDNHKDLVKEGEKWLKETASSCSFVAALIATITFAAAFTVPGGSNQNNGYPIFLRQNLFMLFIISDAVSLFSSTTSLIMFLALLTSRYAEEDFLTSLPTKLITGLSTMFISLAAMMIAFCATLILLIHERTWIIIPMALFACVPVTLYIWFQLPLLVTMFKSTYMSRIFDRNVKPWP